ARLEETIDALLGLLADARDPERFGRRLQLGAPAEVHRKPAEHLEESGAMMALHPLVRGPVLRPDQAGEETARHAVERHGLRVPEYVGPDFRDTDGIDAARP